MNTLTPEDIVWLKELANEIKSQPNRATAMPYYYTIRKQKRVVGMDSGYSDKTVWTLLDGNDPQEFKTEEDGIIYIMENYGKSVGAAEDYFYEHAKEFGVYEYEEDQNVFLTYKGLLKHINLNGHNISRKIDPDREWVEDERVHSYLHHAFRNPEMSKLIEIILKFADKEEK